MTEEYANISNSSIYKADLKKLASYKIDEFDPMTLLTRNGVLSIIAMTGAGKSVFIIDCLQKVHSHFKHVIMISKTAKLQKCYSFFEPGTIYDEFDPDFLEELWNDRVQKQLLGSPQERTLLIMDDILNEKEVRKCKVLDDIFTGGRHVGLSLWCLGHNFTSLKPLQRNNICWAVSFDLDSSKEREHFSQQYLSAQNSRVGFLLHKQITKGKPYQCVVIEVYKNGASTEEKVKRYIANPKPPKFKIKNTMIKQKALEASICCKPRTKK